MKTKKNTITKLDNPNITRNFQNGKMIITVGGKQREITKEQLQTRLANVPTIISSQAIITQRAIDRLTEKIASEQDADKKAKMQTLKSKFEAIQINAPTQEELENKIQGWIDNIEASI